MDGVRAEWHGIKRHFVKAELFGGALTLDSLKALG